MTNRDAHIANLGQGSNGLDRLLARLLEDAFCGVAKDHLEHNVSTIDCQAFDHSGRDDVLGKIGEHDALERRFDLIGC